MKLKERITNKIRAVKEESRRVKPLTYAEWLNDNGLTDNVENRASYGSYILDVDNHNKKADMRLSQIIGRGVFLLCVFVIFIVMCANSVGAVGVASENDFADGSYSNVSVDLFTIEIPYDFGDGSYSIQYFYFYMSDLYGDLFVIDNQVNFYYDILPLYDTIGSYLNDSEIYVYWVEKYPNVNLDTLHWMLTGDTTLLSDMFYSIRADLNYIEQNGYNNGYNVGFDLGVGVGYDNGYDEGHTVGYDDGYDVGIQHGYDDGYDVGVREGYNLGYDEGVDVGETAKKSIFAIFDAPIKVLTSLLDFEIFGINFLSIFKVILTIILLGAIAKFVLSIAL